MKTIDEFHEDLYAIDDLIMESPLLLEALSSSYGKENLFLWLSGYDAQFIGYDVKGVMAMYRLGGVFSNEKDTGLKIRLDWGLHIPKSLWAAMPYYLKVWDNPDHNSFRVTSPLRKIDSTEFRNCGYSGWAVGLAKASTNHLWIAGDALKVFFEEVIDRLDSKPEDDDELAKERALYTGRRHMCTYREIIEFQLRELLEEYSDAPDGWKILCLEGVMSCECRGRCLAVTSKGKVVNFLGDSVFPRMMAVFPGRNRHGQPRKGRTLTDDGRKIVDGLKKAYEAELTSLEESGATRAETLKVRVRLYMLEKHPNDALVCVDIRACAIQLFGLLLNDERLLVGTGVLPSTQPARWKTSEEIWQRIANIFGVTRDMAKAVMMKPVYGGAFTYGDGTPIPEKVLGELGPIVDLINLLKTLDPATTDLPGMKWGLGDPEGGFFIGMKARKYLKRSKTKEEVYYARTPEAQEVFDAAVEQVPPALPYHRDYSFEGTAQKGSGRYLVSLLIHHLDAWVLQETCREFKGYIKTCHDGFYVHPNDASYLITCLQKALSTVYANNCNILEKYIISAASHCTDAKARNAAIEWWRCELMAGRWKNRLDVYKASSNWFKFE